MQKIKILIIDDEEDYCMILKSYFSKKNCEVFLAFTLKEGLRLLQHNKIDILFLDNNLPDGNGWQIVDKILTECTALHIYLISAYKHKSDFKSTSSQITVWEKPISFELLENIIYTRTDNPQQKESI